MPRIQKSTSLQGLNPLEYLHHKTQGCRWHVCLQEHRAGEIQAVHVLQPIQSTELLSSLKVHSPERPLIKSRKNLLSDILTEFACLSVPFYCDRTQKNTWDWAGTLPLNVSVSLALLLLHKTVLLWSPLSSRLQKSWAPGRTQRQNSWYTPGSAEVGQSVRVRGKHRIRDPMVQGTSCAICMQREQRERRVKSGKQSAVSKTDLSQERGGNTRKDRTEGKLG